MTNNTATAPAVLVGVLLAVVVACGGGSSTAASPSPSPSPSPSVVSVAPAPPASTTTSSPAPLTSESATPSPPLARSASAGGGLQSIGTGAGLTETLPADAGAGSWWGPTIVMGNVVIGTVTMTGPIAQVDRVIAGLRPRMRQCHQKILQVTPTAIGNATFVMTVEADGSVGHAKGLLVDAQLPTDLTACIVTLLQKAQFDPPGSGNPVVVHVALSFSKPTKP